MNTNTSSSLATLHFHAPGTYASGVIHYATGSCTQGHLLVAQRDTRICAIFLDDSLVGLQQQLKDAFPNATLQEAGPALTEDLAQVIALIDRKTIGVHLDLDVGGTSFQQRVWQSLCAIPAGETRTYQEVAESIGSPKAVRAVASACASNVLAVVIPCHRVIRSDGAISGYRWGLERKRSLLQQERKDAAT